MANVDIADLLLPSISQPRTCYNCERVFFRGSRGNRDALKCCSRSCGWAWQTKAKIARKPICFVISKARCVRCSAWFVKSGNHVEWCSPACKRDFKRQKAIGLRGSTCVECASCFIGTRVGVILCSKACAKRRIRRTQIANGNRAAQRKAGKLRLKGVTVETVNPLVVLDRDRWTCQLCGVRTPKKLRGSFDDRAPEVDHIIPIAQGGEHSYRNTHCACRRCNLAKSSTARGQMRLFG